MSKLIILVSLLSGCITPHQQKKEEVLMCKALCDDNVQKFSPFTGECRCHMPRHQGQ